MSKSKFRRARKKINTKHYDILMQYFYNLYMNSQEAEGIDAETMERRMRLFWDEGQVGIYKLPLINEIAYAPFAVAGAFNRNGFPTYVYLVDEFGVGRKIIPYGAQKVNKDVVIAYALKSHRPIKEIVSYQVERICAVRNAISQNLHINMIPFLIKESHNDQRLKNIFDSIFEGEEVVAVAPEDLEIFQDTLELKAPYIIDKLQAYEKDLFNELLTFLGINNMGTQEKKERMITDEIESNNELIQIFGDCYLREAEIESGKIKEVLKATVTFKDTSPYLINEIEKKEEEEGK